MLKKPTDRIKDSDIREHFDFIQAEALGNMLELAAIPTTTVPLLSDNEIGRYLDKIYIRKGLRIYRLDPGAVITVA